MARNGEEAIGLVREQLFDMILMDLEMPVMNGVETTAAIRAIGNEKNVDTHHHHNRHTEDEIFNKLNTSHFSGAIIKPFLPGKIKQLIAANCHQQSD